MIRLMTAILLLHFITQCIELHCLNFKLKIITLELHSTRFYLCIEVYYIEVYYIEVYYIEVNYIEVYCIPAY